MNKMTSFGIEWDTNVLVHIDKKNWPKDVYFKIPFEYDITSKTTFTLEKWKPSDKKEISELDCFASLEIQMGVFENKDNTFDIEEFKKTCKKFSILWKYLMERKTIVIGDKEYDLLIYLDTEDEKDKNKRLYYDCSRTIPDNKGYTNDFFYDNTHGAPQLTFGIELKYIISIFSYISLIKLKQENSGLLLDTLYATYYHTGYFSDSIKLRDLNMISLLLLIGYYILTSVVYLNQGKHEYMKSNFIFKCRTNMRIIYDVLDLQDKEKIIKKYIEYLKNNSDLNVSEVTSDFSSRFFKPKTGFIVNTNKKSNIFPLSIVRNNLENYTSVKYFPSWWSYKPPRIQEVDNTIVYSESGLASMDYGEWTIGKNNTIYLEFRAIPLLLSIITNTNYIYYKYISSDGLCDVTVKALELLNECLKVSPNIILPDID